MLDEALAGLEPVSSRLVLCLARGWMLWWVLLPLDLIKFLFEHLRLLGVSKARDMEEGGP